MNVCIIAGEYSNSNDGIGRYTTNLLKKLDNSDHDINLEKIPQTNNIPANFKQKNLLSLLIQSTVKNYLKPMELELDYLARLRRDRFSYIKSLKNVNAQIYHAMSPSEAIAPIILNKRPLITTFHDIIPLVSENRFLLEKFYFNYYSNFAKKSDIILADSKKTKQDLNSILKIPEHKIIVIYPGIDTNRFHKKRWKQNKIKTILYLGGLIKRKGIYETIYAFEKLCKKRRDARLLIGGGGNELDKLKAEVNRLKINNLVSFLGFVDEKNIVNIYHRADLFVYPSKYEGFGYTPLEAMACGIPVVTANSSSIPEVVEDVAIKVNPYNSNDIYLKINMVLDDINLQKKMHEKGPIQANKFSEERCAKEVLEVYQSLI